MLSTTNYKQQTKDNGAHKIFDCSAKPKITQNKRKEEIIIIKKKKKIMLNQFNIGYVNGKLVSM